MTKSKTPRFRNRLFSLVNGGRGASGSHNQSYSLGPPPGHNPTQQNFSRNRPRTAGTPVQIQQPTYNFTPVPNHQAMGNTPVPVRRPIIRPPGGRGVRFPTHVRGLNIRKAAVTIAASVILLASCVKLMSGSSKTTPKQDVAIALIKSLAKTGYGIDCDPGKGNTALDTALGDLAKAGKSVGEIKLAMSNMLGPALPDDKLFVLLATNDAETRQNLETSYDSVMSHASRDTLSSIHFPNSPLKGKEWSQLHITSPFGPRDDAPAGASDDHKGSDNKAQAGDEVVAVQKGVVTNVEHFYESGGVVAVDHGGGISTLYWHVKPGVKVGDEIEAGQTIAKVGAGTWMGSIPNAPHLHFEVVDNKGKPDRVVSRHRKSMDPTELYYSDGYLTITKGRPQYAPMVLRGMQQGVAFNQMKAYIEGKKGVLANRVKGQGEGPYYKKALKDADRVAGDVQKGIFAAFVARQNKAREEQQQLAVQLNDARDTNPKLVYASTSASLVEPSPNTNVSYAVNVTPSTATTAPAEGQLVYVSPQLFRKFLAEDAQLHEAARVVNRPTLDVLNAQQKQSEYEAPSRDPAQANASSTAKGLFQMLNGLHVKMADALDIDLPVTDAEWRTPTAVRNDIAMANKHLVYLCTKARMVDEKFRAENGGQGLYGDDALYEVTYTDPKTRQKVTEIRPITLLDAALAMWGDGDAGFTMKCIAEMKNAIATKDQKGGVVVAKHDAINRAGSTPQDFGYKLTIARQTDAGKANAFQAQQTIDQYTYQKALEEQDANKVDMTASPVTTPIVVADTTHRVISYDIQKSTRQNIDSMSRQINNASPRLQMR